MPHHLWFFVHQKGSINGGGLIVVALFFNLSGMLDSQQREIPFPVSSLRLSPVGRGSCPDG